jgi:hypothetical protein
MKEFLDYQKFQHFQDTDEDFSSGNKIKFFFALFNYIIKHLVRILLVIHTPRLNTLLIGIEGSGKNLC